MKPWVLAPTHSSASAQPTYNSEYSASKITILLPTYENGWMKYAYQRDCAFDSTENIKIPWSLIPAHVKLSNLGDGSFPSRLLTILKEIIQLTAWKFFHSFLSQILYAESNGESLKVGGCMLLKNFKTLVLKLFPSKFLPRF